jgi:DNA-directed RNA polymerase specialized sigma24 family protein
MDDWKNVKQVRENLYGENVKIIRQYKLTLKLLTPIEKDEVVDKYETGMTMTEIANIYGCHYTTVGRLLRRRGVEIR